MFIVGLNFHLTLIKFNFFTKKLILFLNNFRVFLQNILIFLDFLKLIGHLLNLIFQKFDPLFLNYCLILVFVTISTMMWFWFGLTTNLILLFFIFLSINLRSLCWFILLENHWVINDEPIYYLHLLYSLIKSLFYNRLSSGLMFVYFGKTNYTFFYSTWFKHFKISFGWQIFRSLFKFWLFVSIARIEICKVFTNRYYVFQIVYFIDLYILLLFLFNLHVRMWLNYLIFYIRFRFRFFN